MHTAYFVELLDPLRNPPNAENRTVPIISVKLAAQSRVYKNVEDTIDLTAVKRVGEFGCGSGHNLYPFFRQGMDVVGVDLGTALVKAGQGVGMDLRQGSIEDMNGAPFDLLILSHVLEHLPDPVGDMRRLLQNLKPDGIQPRVVKSTSSATRARV